MTADLQGDGALMHLKARQATVVLVSQAPLERLQAPPTSPPPVCLRLDE